MAALFLVGATAVTFFLVGTVVVATCAMAALTHNQDHMERKVRRWQDEAARLGHDGRLDRRGHSRR